MSSIFSKDLFRNKVFRKKVFSKEVFSKALLTETEINQLINAAPIAGPGNSNEQFQRGRIGDQISSSHGSGSDFAEVRAYFAGDDPRHIDWRATARAQKPLVRTYHSELNQPLCLLIDRRSSMRFATRVRLKVTQALRMALWIGGREARLGRDISAVILDAPCQWLPSQPGLSSLKLMAKLANIPCLPSKPGDEHQGTHKKDWNSIFSGLRQRIPQGSELVMLSDFSELGDEDDKMLRLLGRHCLSKAIQIFDPSEARFNLSVAMELQWGQKTRYLASSEEIDEALDSHYEKIAKHFRRASVGYFQLSVEQNDLSLLKTEQ